tara:strand:- start:313 stop:1182 length:870 start_codon:yes stop_codon:yes gene_type:complete
MTVMSDSKLEDNKEDLKLVKDALSGDKKPLDRLIRKYQPFIYNVAWKMAWDEVDAKDITQEVLIKILTKLSQFDGKGSFKAWVYRIAVNEFLNTKRRSKEKDILGFDDFKGKLDAMPDTTVSEKELHELETYSREINLRCMSGMIMCLNREQRLLFILGDLFGIDHNLGAEIFETSRQNYRVKLHRARTDISNFMNKQCGLIDPSNPCRCPKKAKVLKEMGVLTENNYKFKVDYKSKIADYAENTLNEATDNINSKYLSFLRDHPAKDDFDSSIINDIIKDKDIWGYFE